MVTVHMVLARIMNLVSAPLATPKGNLLRGASALGMGMVFCFMLNHCFRINDARICEVVFLDGIIKGLE